MGNEGVMLLGFKNHMVPIPPFLWRRAIRKEAAGAKTSLARLTPEHRRVRDFVVKELPAAGAALTAERIAAGVDLHADEVTPLIEDLERAMTFLYRSSGADVTWAYPGTVDSTPHRVTFGSGEQLNAA